MRKILILFVLIVCAAPFRAQEIPVTVTEQHSAEESPAIVHAGAGIGSVAGVNLVANIQMSRFELGVSGAYWSKDYYGLSVHVAVPFFTYADFSGNIAGLGGVHRVPIPAGDGTEAISGYKTQPFLGTAVIFHLTNFYVQTGIEFGFNDRPANLQPLWQFGYLFRL